jgi:ArsR family transcriptional regulator
MTSPEDPAPLHESDVGDQDQSVLERAAEFLRAAGEPSRLRLLLLLRDGERAVSELAGRDTLSATSQRLRVLRTARLVRRRKEGRNHLYSLNDDHIAELVRSAIEHAREEQ